MFVVFILFFTSGVICSNNNNDFRESQTQPGNCLGRKGLFPSTACNKYISCWDGRMAEFICPSGTVFNPAKGQCDWPGEVNCSGKPISEIPTTHAPAASLNSTRVYFYTNPTTSLPVFEKDQQAAKEFCLGKTGSFPSGSCSKYFSCWNGNGALLICAPGLSFNPEKRYCDWSINVKCSLEGQDQASVSVSTDQPPPTATTPLPSVTTFLPRITTLAAKPSTSTQAPAPSAESKQVSSQQCLGRTGLFPGTTCHKYVNCWNGNGVEQTCPPGTAFNGREGYCDWPENVDCSFRTTTTTRVSENSGTDLVCLGDSGTFRDRNNCSLYFTCVNRRVVAKFACPPGFKFNDKIGVCDYEERVNCSDEPYVYPWKTNIYPRLPEDIFSQVQYCRPGTIIRLNPECTVACVCKQGVAEVVQCPNGLMYDSKTNRCLPPHIARC